MNTKLVAIVGMCGSGKSVVSDAFVASGFSFLRFGQITLDELMKAGIEPNEKNQRQFREDLRRKHGPAAYAILNMPKFDALLERGNVIGDGLYSWSEYKVLKEKFGNRLVVVAVYAPPEKRYKRLSERHPDEKDLAKRNHHFSEAEAKSRDYSEIERIEKGGPIAMADYMILNTSSVENLHVQTESVIKEILG